MLVGWGAIYQILSTIGFLSSFKRLLILMIISILSTVISIKYFLTEAKNSEQQIENNQNREPRNQLPYIQEHIKK